MNKFLAFIAVFWLALSSVGNSTELRQTGDARWIVFASASDPDEAIGIAQAYRWRFPNVRVVRSSNGWLAVIGGPVTLEGGATATRDRIVSQGGVPTDIFLSNGEAFLQTIWTLPEDDTEIWEYEHGDPLGISRFGLDFVVSDRFASDFEARIPTLTAYNDGQIVANAEIAESQTRDANSRLRFAWLDRSSTFPQLLFSSFWMGAHCCTVTKILSEADGEWHVTNGRTLDGDLGYRLIDVNGDSELELVSYDNSFLYAFAAYAFSWMPVSVQKFENGELVDKRWDAEYRSIYLQEAYRLEHLAMLDPELWGENGFLAAWVALKSLSGRHDEAWNHMLSNYDRQSDWPLTLCEVDTVDGLCPPGSERRVGFPEALHDHLDRMGYLAPPDAVQVETKTTAPQIVAAAPNDDAQPSSVPSLPNIGSSGTGFFISLDGHFITNHHVVDGCSDVLVRAPNSGVQTATVVAADTVNDLALLRVDGPVPGVARIRDTLRLGEQVAAFGFPLSNVLSSRGNFTLGNVTALAGMADDTRYLQMSTPIQPGNSGGPLVDEFGNIVGVVTAKLDSIVALAVSGDIPQNVNFAIRADTLQAFVSAQGVALQGRVEKRQLTAPELAEHTVTFSGAVLCKR